MAEFLTLSEAVSRHLHDGDAVAMEGFTHLIPFAAGHEVIRQERKGLTLIRMTPDLIYDQLIGMGSAAKLVFSWGGNPGVGSLHRLRDAVENGWPKPLALEEHSHAAMSIAYEAGAQIDRFANLNTTVVGDYAKPKVRLPGGGGAPEIATDCSEIFITMVMGPRGFVEKLPFVTSLGHGSGPGSRRALGVASKGPTKVITDLCVLEPDPRSCELSVTALYPGVTREQVQEQCGWQMKFAAELPETPAPTAEELQVLRDIQARTAAAHGSNA